MNRSVRAGTIRRGAVAILLAGALVGAPVSAASAAVPSASMAAATDIRTAIPLVKPTVKTFENCTALNKTYKGGVARAGVKYNKVNGKNKPFKVKPTFSTALYNANKRMDRDKDGIACEKG